ncbi:MAG TPA: TGS domain-containing protein [Longimicrobiales bacterium]|nr:TGS domain-containing protein [Longimicrobiales bacterium]
MSTNAGPVYREAEARFRAAVTREEKLAALEEMLRVVPKHKGTEKLCADLRSRISKLKHEPRKKGGSRGVSHRIVHEGAGQIALVGPPNAGKSTLVAALTHARPEVAPYPMSTHHATPGMMPFENVAFQLVDLPPLCSEHVEPWVYDIVRGADLAWLVLSIEHPLVGYDDTLELLRAKAIQLVPWDADGPVERRPGWTYLRTLMVVTGMDLPGADADLLAFEELLDRPWPRAAVAGVSGLGFAELGRHTFRALGIIRVFSKEPGKEPDLERPFTLPCGATVSDLAKAIHKEIADEFRYARVWGPSAHDGQSVRGGHVLLEGDVVEIHR